MSVLFIISGVINYDEIHYTAGPTCSIQLVYNYNDTQAQPICLQSNTNQCFHTLDALTDTGTKVIVFEYPKNVFLALPSSGLYWHRVII